MPIRNFKERFKESQEFEDFVSDLIARGGTESEAGKFPVYTREEAENFVLGWSNSLEAVGTVLQPKDKSND
jgi:hypothetical protein